MVVVVVQPQLSCRMCLLGLSPAAALNFGTQMGDLWLPWVAYLTAEELKPFSGCSVHKWAELAGSRSNYCYNVPC